MNHSRIYEFRFRNVPEIQKQTAWRQIARHVMTFMPGARKILDPCAGHCEFANHAGADEIWAVDLETSFLEKAAPGVRRISGNILDLELPSGYFDGVFISNFLEHLDSAEAAARFLGRMHDALVPGGRLVVIGPNFKYCGSDYFDCSDHKLVLTHVSVEELLYSERFRILKTHPRYLPFSFRRQRLPIFGPLVNAYLRFPFLWKLMGKQFLLVAEKPLRVT